MSPTTVEIAIEPKAAADREPLRRILNRISGHDASFLVISEDESGQTLVQATNERQLDRVVESLQREFGERLEIGAPQVAYRESLAKKVDIDYTHKEQSGGSGQFGRIKFTVEPGERGQGIIFNDEVKGGNVPKEYIPSVEKGIREVAASGSLIGFPIIDFTATLYDGAYHDVDSSALAFEITGRGGMHEAAQKAGIKLLEPIMRLAVIAREQWASAIESDLIDREATIEAANTGRPSLVVATVPMARLFGYERHLSAMTKGEGAVAMIWDHYAPVPQNFIGPEDPFPAAAALRA